MKGKQAVFWALGAALVLKLFFFDFIIVQGRSMEPAIQNGKVLVISRLRYGLRLPWQRDYLVRWDSPKEGEVVVFYTPSGEIAVKRCVGLTPEGGFLAEGDNKGASYDSRSYGAVPVGSIIGKVLGY